MPHLRAHVRLLTLLSLPLLLCQCTQAPRLAEPGGPAPTSTSRFLGFGYGFGFDACGLSDARVPAATLMRDSQRLPDPTYPFPDGLVQEVGRPMRGLSPRQQTAYERGAELFNRVFTTAQGRGSLFNDSRCANCHLNGGAGGSGKALVPHIAVVDQRDPRWAVNGTGYDEIVPLGGPVQQSHLLVDGVDLGSEPLPTQAAIDAFQAEQAALGHAIGRDLVISLRTTTPVAGAGLLCAIPLSSLVLRQAVPKPFGIGGHLNVLSGQLGADLSLTNRIGRLGLKAQMPDDQAFLADAAVQELGLSNPHNPIENRPNQAPVSVASPDLTPQQVEDFETYCNSLAPPRFLAIDEAGQKAFYKAGCAECHYNGYQTACRTADLPASLRPLANVVLDQPVYAYTDLMVHRMGLENADGFKQGSAMGDEWRTAPLWGLHLKKFFWHDNRALTLEQAVLAHQATGSEANGVIQNYLGSGPKAANNLSAAERASVISFLSQL